MSTAPSSLRHLTSGEPAGRTPAGAAISRRSSVALAVPAALLFGALAATFPALAIAIGALVVLGLALAFAPFLALAASTISGSVAPEFLEPLEPLWSALYRGHRLVILAAVIAMLVHRGFRDHAPPPTVAAYAVVLVFTFTLAARPPGLSPDKSIFALLTLNIGWLASQIRWRSAERITVLKVVSAVPLVSVLVGFVLSAAGLHLVHSVDYTGVARLHGAGIAAYLALAAAGGAAAAVLLYRLGRTRAGISFVLINLVIVALTATRGGVIATLILLVPFALTLVLSGGPTASQVAVRILAGMCAASFVVVAVLPPLVARSFHAGQAGFESSGRTEAWSYFLGETKGSEAFGRGLGSAVLLAQAADDLPGDFRGVHNDVLRIFIECGFIGGLLVVVAVARTLRAVYRQTATALRPDLLALFIAFLFYSFVDNTLSTFQFFLPLGLVLSVYSSAQHSSDDEEEAERRDESPLVHQVPRG